MLSGDRAELYEQRLASGFDLSSADLASAWRALRGGECDWLVAKYAAPTQLELDAFGKGGFSSLRERLTDGAVLYGAFCVTAVQGGATLRKLVSFTWVGEDVAGMARARVSMHRQAVDNYFVGTVASLSFTLRADVYDLSAIIDQVRVIA